MVSMEAGKARRKSARKIVKTRFPAGEGRPYANWHCYDGLSYFAVR